MKQYEVIIDDNEASATLKMNKFAKSGYRMVDFKATEGFNNSAINRTNVIIIMEREG